MTPADLRAWRSRLGLSQIRAAALLGVHAVTLCRWERGRAPMPPMLRLACQAITDGFAGGTTAPVQYEPTGHSGTVESKP